MFSNSLVKTSNLALGVCEKFQKATIISFVMSVRLSVHPQGTTQLPLNGLEILYLSIFKKYVKKIPVSLKCDKTT